MSTVGMSSMSFSSFRCPPPESLTHSHFGSVFVVAFILLLVKKKKKKLLGPNNKVEYISLLVTLANKYSQLIMWIPEKRKRFDKSFKLLFIF